MVCVIELLKVKVTLKSNIIFKGIINIRLGESFY